MSRVFVIYTLTSLYVIICDIGCVAALTVTATVGEDATLPCRTDIDAAVDWWHQAFGAAKAVQVCLGGEIVKNVRHRVSINSSTTQRGDYNLVIHGVQFTDAGLYTCIEEAGLGPGNFLITLIVINSTANVTDIQRVPARTLASDDVVQTSLVTGPSATIDLSNATSVAPDILRASAPAVSVVDVPVASTGQLEATDVAPVQDVGGSTEATIVVCMVLIIAVVIAAAAVCVVLRITVLRNRKQCCRTKQSCWAGGNEDPESVEKEAPLASKPGMVATGTEMTPARSAPAVALAEIHTQTTPGLQEYAALNSTCPRPEVSPTMYLDEGAEDADDGDVSHTLLSTKLMTRVLTEGSVPAETTPLTMTHPKAESTALYMKNTSTKPPTYEEATSPVAPGREQTTTIGNNAAKAGVVGARQAKSSSMPADKLRNDAVSTSAAKSEKCIRLDRSNVPRQGGKDVAKKRKWQ